MNQNQIALSFDIEDWYHTPLITGSSFARYKTLEDFFKTWKGDYDFITVATLRLLEILDQFNIQATFFVVADIVDKYPEIINALKKTAHEIGCHGLHHSTAIHSKTKKPLQTIKEWETELLISKDLLEKTFGKKIIGYRAPSAYFATWMIEPLEKAGFKYDSSISFNSFYNKTNVLLKNIPSYPYMLNKEDLSSVNPNSCLLEIPSSNYKLFNIYLPAGGAFFFRSLGLLYFKKVLRQNLKKGDTMFYLHPLDLTCEKIPLNNFRHRPFYWINKGEKTEKRLIKLIKLNKEKLTTCEAIYNKNIGKYVF